MLTKNLENSTLYDIFLYKFWKKARVYYTLSISRGGGGGPGPRAPPWVRQCCNTIPSHISSNINIRPCLDFLSLIDAHSFMHHPPPPPLPDNDRLGDRKYMTPCQRQRSTSTSTSTRETFP